MTSKVSVKGIQRVSDQIQTRKHCKRRHLTRANEHDPELREGMRRRVSAEHNPVRECTGSSAAEHNPYSENGHSVKSVIMK